MENQEFELIEKLREAGFSEQQISAETAHLLRQGDTKALEKVNYLIEQIRNWKNERSK